MGGRTLLIVDGDHRVRRALGCLVAAAGYRPVPTGHGEALAAAASAGADAIAVVEPREPTPEQGCVLIQGLTALGVPVLALSLRPTVRAASTGAGAAGFLTKNCSPEQLLEQLARIR